MPYSEKVLDHYNNPRNVGSFDKNDPNVGTGLVGAPECFSGDTLIAIPEFPGYISLKQAYEKQSPFYVWLYNLNCNKFEIKKAICLYNGKKNIIKINIDNDKDIKTTKNHKFLTLKMNYVECENLLNTSLKSFNKILNSKGYWTVDKNYEHLEYFRSYYETNEKFLFFYNIDHIDSNKSNNSIENLQKLSISDHNKKTNIHLRRKLIEQKKTELSTKFPKESIVKYSEEYFRFEIGNLLNITTEEVKFLQSIYQLSTTNKKITIEEQKILASERMKIKNPYFNFTDEQKFKFASKPGNSNPKWIDIDNNTLLEYGNKLFVENKKLTKKIWVNYAKLNSLPQNLSSRFGNFNNFKLQAITYNHKITKIDDDNEFIDVYDLSVEENNNYVVLTDIKLNSHTGFVVKNCGDVLKLQLKIKNGIIEDAKFKTFGCGSAISASSLATELVKGKTIEEAQAIKNTQIVEELALPPVKIHCSVLAEDAIKAAINDYIKKNE